MYYEAYSPSAIAHQLWPLYVFVNADSGSGSDWAIQNQLFCAWGTAQEFTVPLWVLGEAATNDNMYLTSANSSSPPVVSGYDTIEIVGYVYSTQVCGSVPIYSAFEERVGDHWYTTSQTGYQQLLASGWADAGIPFYALPPTGGKYCYISNNEDRSENAL